MMSKSQNEIRLSKGFSRVKLIIPTILGLGVVFYMFRDDFLNIQELAFSSNAAIALLAASMLVFIRDLAYVVRIKILSMGELGWRHSIRSVLLWEFSSALTPSVIGGSAFAVLILKREGMSTGRSAATVLATALMDEMFYVIAVPTVVLIAGLDAFFPEQLDWVDFGIRTLFYSGYTLTCIASFIILFALFFTPSAIPKILGYLFKLPILNRWKARASRWAEEWTIASKGLKQAGLKVWAGAGVATLISWSARFLTLNAILYAFIDTVPNANIVARQLAMWIILLLSPTPGSSGIAEIAMPAFIAPLITVSSIGVIILIWRFFTYYIYLILGAIIFPQWFSNTSDRSQVIEAAKN